MKSSSADKDPKLSNYLCIIAEATTSMTMNFFRERFDKKIAASGEQIENLEWKDSLS